MLCLLHNYTLRSTICESIVIIPLLVQEELRAQNVGINGQIDKRANRQMCANLYASTQRHKNQKVSASGFWLGD